MTRQNGLKIQRKIDNMKKRNEKRIILETNEKNVCADGANDGVRRAYELLFVAWTQRGCDNQAG